MIKRGFKNAGNLLLSEIKDSIFHYKGLISFNKYRGKRNLKLNLGSGNTIKKGWVNIDIYAKKADLSLDLRKRFPFTESSVIEIYNEAFFEHLDFPHDAMFFLKECFRVLQKGGKITIGIPDTEWPLKSYIKGYNAPYFKIAKSKGWHSKSFSTRMEHLNYHFRQNGEHKYAYDLESLSKIMTDAGFVNIKKRPFNVRMDSRNRYPGILYVVGQKPF